MEIHHIKQHLSLKQVLDIYLIKVNKNNMVKCPFHDDKTASMQVNLEKNFYKCHACGKKGDQIQLVQDYGKLTKHEALLKCAQMIESTNPTAEINEPLKPTPTMNYHEIPALSLAEVFQNLKPKLNLSSKAKDYLKQRNLNPEKLEIAYNTGKEFDKLKCCLIFPLKNKNNEITSLYGRSIYDNPESKHFYTTNRQGLYPNYPKPETTKLILTEAIIDTATLLQIENIKKSYEILSCYGTNGLTNEHLEAIKNLKNLEEIIFFFDGDTPGNEAVQKHAMSLRDLRKKIFQAGMMT